MPTSEAQKRANKKYYEKLMSDPVTREITLKKMRESTKKANEKRMKEHPEELEYKRIRSRQQYEKWRDDVKQNKPEEYREYLNKARVKYWMKQRETKTAKEFEAGMRKLKFNSPVFYEIVKAEVEKKQAKEF